MASPGRTTQLQIRQQLLRLKQIRPSPFGRGVGLACKTRCGIDISVGAVKAKPVTARIKPVYIHIECSGVCKTENQKPNLANHQIAPSPMRGAGGLTCTRCCVDISVEAVRAKPVTARLKSIYIHPSARYVCKPPNYLPIKECWAGVTRNTHGISGKTSTKQIPEQKSHSTPPTSQRKTPSNDQKTNPQPRPCIGETTPPHYDKPRKTQ